MKSTTCKGTNEQYLEEYHSRPSADFAAEEIKRKYGTELVSSQCRKCGYWHLTVVNSRRQCMFCTDASSFLKDIYGSKEEAQKTAEWMKKEKKVLLHPYKCPHGSGWHLTKRKISSS